MTGTRRHANARAAVCAGLLIAALATPGCGGDSKSATPASGTTPTAKANTVSMPDLTGKDIGSARRSLHALGLRARIEGRYASETAGQVLKTDPAAGAAVTPRTEVALVVSRGPRATPPGGVTTTTPSSQPPTSTTPAGGCPTGQYTAPDGTCQPVPKGNGGAPPVNSPEGQQRLHQSPDCKGVPPPPPGYNGPVQC